MILHRWLMFCSVFTEFKDVPLMWHFDVRYRTRPKSTVMSNAKRTFNTSSCILHTCIMQRPNLRIFNILTQTIHSKLKHMLPNVRNVAWYKKTKLREAVLAFPWTVQNNLWSKPCDSHIWRIWLHIKYLHIVPSYH